MTFTVNKIAEAIAAHLSSHLPGVTYYEDPNQQGTKCPCMFIQLMSSDVKLRQAGRLLRTLRLDLTYLEDYNLPDLQVRYQSVSEVLDLNMELFFYGTDEDFVLLRTYNRQSVIDLDALHYKFDLQIWLTPEEDRNFMQSMTLVMEVTNGKS